MPRSSIFATRRIWGTTTLLSAALAANTAPLKAQTPPTANPLPGAPTNPNQTAEIELLRQQLAELKARLDKLENAQGAAKTPASNVPSAPTPPVATAPANVSTASKLPLTVSGLLQVHSLNFLDENRKSGGLPSTDTLRLRRGELRLTAPAITKRISGTIMLDPAKTTALRGANSTSTIRERDNVLQEIQISYLLGKKGADSHFLDAGQFKIPVGYESTLTGSGALPLVERSLIFSQRDPFDGGYGDVRETGVQLRGTLRDFDYRIGVFNGLGDRQNALSLSDHKAVLGLVSYRGIRNLLIGVSGGQGNTGVNSFVTVNGATTTVISRDNRSLFNAFGVYKRNKWSLQAEYLHGRAAPIAVETSTLAGRDLRGYYAGVGYLFSPKIEGIFRYDTLNTNRDLSDAAVRDLILGVNYYIKGNNAKIQTNLIRRDGGGNAPSNQNPSNNLRNDRLELRTALQVAF